MEGRIEAVLDQYVRPLLRAHGGNVEILGAEGTREGPLIFLQNQGAFRLGWALPRIAGCCRQCRRRLFGVRGMPAGNMGKKQKSTHIFRCSQLKRTKRSGIMRL